MANSYFLETLLWIQKQVHFSVPSDRALTVFNLACGACEEANDLTSFFDSLTMSGSHYWGVDLDENSIIKARRETVKLSAENRWHFSQGDARYLNPPLVVAAMSDVILFRHQFLAQDFIRQETVWIELILRAFRLLAPGGVIIFTSYEWNEARLLQTCLEMLPCKVLLHSENPHARQVVHPTKRIALDQFVTAITT